MNDPTGTRLVPLSHADVSWLHTSADTPQRTEALMRLNIGFNRAPANPAEVMRSVIEPHLPIDVDHPRVVVAAVLAALGCVVERPANTGDHHAD